MGNNIFYIIKMSKSAKYCQVYGKKKNATALALIKLAKNKGEGQIHVNGYPLNRIEPQCMRLKVEEPILLLGHNNYYSQFDIKIRVTGGGPTAQSYAIRQSIAKA